MRLKTLKSPLLRKYKTASAFTDIAFEKRNLSPAQKSVDKACSAEAEAIFTIAKEGSLDEKIALEYQLQQRDMQKYAKSDNDAKNIAQGLKDMESGLASYADLTERQQTYREQASRYTDRNRDAKLDVPKDGMRYALASQSTRLHNRQSLQLSDSEKILLTARRALLNSLQKEYSLLQNNVIHEIEASRTKPLE